MDIKHILKGHAYQNIPLSYEEAYELGVYALKGCAGDTLAQVQSIAALSALHTRATYLWQWNKNAQAGHADRLPQNAAEQIAGICAAVFDHDIATSSFGFLELNVPYAMDNCGMGGDLVKTANVSTIAALIAASAEIPMCKHGSPANADAGQHGSSDFVSMLGINTLADKHAVEACVEQEKFGYTEALDVRYKKIHMQTHKVAMLPHMNDIIGPITNPLAPCLMTRRALGVNHLVPPRIVAEAYLLLNKKGVTHLEHGIFLRGFSDKNRYAGMDEVSICEGGTQIAELRGTTIREYDLYAKDFGLECADVDEISPPLGMSKGDFSLGILRGEIAGPPLDMILANAAILFYLALRSKDLRECCTMARVVHARGAAYEKALTVKKLLPM